MRASFIMINKSELPSVIFLSHSISHLNSGKSLTIYEAFVMNSRVNIQFKFEVNLFAKKFKIVF